MEHIIIGIRADGGARIGMGHLMRCLSIAIALETKKVQVVFITNHADSAAWIQEKGFCCRVLKETDMTAEIPEMLAVIEEFGIKLLIVDSYKATGVYFTGLRSMVKVISLDDMGLMELPVDGLINYNIYGDRLPYREKYPAETLLLLGSRYAPVKKEFSDILYTVKEQPRHIMITMGGSDTFNIAGQLGKRLLKNLPSYVELTLICGRFSPHIGEVKALEAMDERVTVLTDVTDMWNVMSKADVAVAAAGSTMYELCTLGVPTVCCYYVENQRQIAEAFGNRTSMVNAGDFSKEPEQVLGRITEAVEGLLFDFAKRKALSEEMKSLSDGRGAYRIAEELLGFLSENN